MPVSQRETVGRIPAGAGRWDASRVGIARMEVPIPTSPNMSPRRSVRPYHAKRAACGAALLLATCVSIASASPRPIPDGPTGTVSGRIVRSDGPKYDILVVDQETWRSVVTRTDGTFTFERVPVGSHLFRIGSYLCE